MSDLFSYGLLVFTSFFTLINPISAMSVFLGLTSNIDEKSRALIAKRAAIATFLIILFFAFSGQFLFKFFNISINSLRIAGGAIFFVMGFDMLNARLSPLRAKDSEIKQTLKDIAITPLAIPMLCGPGSITNAIVLMEDTGTSIAMKITFVIGLLLIVFVTYLILVSSSKLIKLLGETGINVLLRLMGLIVMVIAVEFFLTGIKPYLLSLLGK